MTNREIYGEIELENGMIMCFNINSTIEYKKLTGRNVYKDLEIMRKAEEVKLAEAEKAEALGEEYEVDFTENFELIRDLYFACLKPYQPEITIVEAGSIFARYPNALGEVLAASHSKADAEETKPKAAKGKTSKN